MLIWQIVTIYINLVMHNVHSQDWRMNSCENVATHQPSLIIITCAPLVSFIRTTVLLISRFILYWLLMWSWTHRWCQYRRLSRNQNIVDWEYTHYLYGSIKIAKNSTFSFWWNKTPQKLLFWSMLVWIRSSSNSIRWWVRKKNSIQIYIAVLL